MTVRMEAVAQPIIEGARDETKSWLRIETAQDDAAIEALCRSAIGMAEDFCAQRLFARAGEEMIAPARTWWRLHACPVRGIAAVAAVDAGGAESPIAADGYAIDIDADGDGWVRVMTAPLPGRISIGLTAGLAEDWADLPDPLRQGVVRLAAHLFGESASDTPPAIVTALWRPWRRMRLA